MSLAHYPALLTYALKLLERYNIYADAHEIVENAYFTYETPDKKHVKKILERTYTDAVQAYRNLKKPQYEKKRICAKCKAELPITAFTRNSAIRHTCDNCLNAYFRQWCSRNIEKRRAVARRSEHKNRHKRKKRPHDPLKYQQWRKNNPDKISSQNGRRRFKRRSKK